MNDDKLAAPIALTEEEVEKKLYHEIWVEPLGPLRADEIFADMSMYLDINCTTLAKKGHDTDHSAVANNNLTLTAA